MYSDFNNVYIFTDIILIELLLLHRCITILSNYIMVLPRIYYECDCGLSADQDKDGICYNTLGYGEGVGLNMSRFLLTPFKQVIVILPFLGAKFLFFAFVFK